MTDSQQPSLEWLSREYYDLNGDQIEVLEEPPTALQFARLVQVSRPALIKGIKVPSAFKWTNEYLINKMESHAVSVAVTPNGRADAVTPGPDGKRLYFAEPAVEKMTMNSFLSNLSEDDSALDTERYYLQSQNGNLYSNRFFEGQDDPSEFEPLRQDVPSEIKWCSEALDKAPDAVNLWIGDSKSVTSIHNPYENIYTVVRETKHFTLLPPTDGWYLDERSFPHATYVRDSGGRLTLQPSSEDTAAVRWSSISDPHLAGRLSPKAHPIHISISQGESIYIPVGWWHHVRQSGITIALNWWYDTEMRGSSWVFLSFLRAIKNVPPGNAES
ncbi:hypothetical protein GYMLUDRAFT_1015919 [Collybiopsis luxurians FD-317 M1]|nr:hypothetical protein GYMLUDRAFT_1015919 [Collybiopsis luxurians FD-317 M1]